MGKLGDMETVGQRIARLYENYSTYAPGTSSVEAAGDLPVCAHSEHSVGEGAMGQVFQGEGDTLIKVTRSANAVSPEWEKAITFLTSQNRNAYKRRATYAKLALPSEWSPCSVDGIVHSRTVMPMIEGRSLSEILQAIYDEEQGQSLFSAPADDVFMERRENIPLDVITNIITSSKKYDPDLHADTLNGVGVSDDEYAGTIMALVNGSFRADVDAYMAERTAKIARAIVEFDAVMAKVMATVASMHASGYYHNDLHEENIIVNDAGDVWIIDWDEVSTAPKMPVMETALLHVACQRIKDSEGRLKYGGFMYDVNKKTVRNPNVDSENGSSQFGGGKTWTSAAALAAFTIFVSVVGSLA